MKKFWFLTFCAVCVLSACTQSTKQKLGLAKQAPNEFMVVSKPPLSLPPEYDLRPVEEMKHTPVDMSVRTDGMSAGEKELMANIQAENSEEDIKSKIDAELKELKQAHED